VRTEKTVNVTQELVDFIRSQFCLDWFGIHGAAHWARVRVNGLQLARTTGANVKVVELFAFLHDAQRQNDRRDLEHGERAAGLARELNGQLFSLDRSELLLLEHACREHSNGGLEADVTIQTCWDADRLDLGRVGKHPDPRFLCTETARQPETIEVAYLRSIAGW
jgi:uncharacterized protein